MSEPKGVTKQDLMDAVDSIKYPDALVEEGEFFVALSLIRRVVMALPDEELTWRGQTKEQRGKFGVATLIKGGKDNG